MLLAYLVSELVKVLVQGTADAFYTALLVGSFIGLVLGAFWWSPWLLERRGWVRPSGSVTLTSRSRKAAA